MGKEPAVGLEVLDNTTLENFLTCARKGYFRHVRHLASPSPHPALTFGQAVHKAIEVRWETEGDVEEAIASFHAHLLESAYEPDKLRTAEKGEAILRYYFKAEPYPPNFEVVGVEEGFRCNLGEVNGRSILYMGLIDLVYRWPNYGLLARDYKTHSYMPPMPRPNRQLTGYTYALVDYYGESEVFGAEIFGLKVPRGNGAHECGAQKAQYSATEREEWRLETLKLVEQIDLCFEAGVWPMNTSSCKKWNTLCPYYRLCSQRVALGDVYIGEDDYVVEPWVPLAARDGADE